MDYHSLAESGVAVPACVSYSLYINISGDISLLMALLSGVFDLRRADPFHNVGQVFDFWKRYVNIIFQVSYTNPSESYCFFNVFVTISSKSDTKCASCIGRNFSYSAFAWAFASALERVPLPVKSV